MTKKRIQSYKEYLPGLLLCLALMGGALGLSRLLPPGGVILAMALGLGTANLVRLPPGTARGIGAVEKYALAGAILLMGLRLDFRRLTALGFPSLLLMLSAMAFTLLLTPALGRLFRTGKKLSLLVGIGNGICGSSAIAAAQGIVRAEEEEVGAALGVINLLGTLGMFLLPGAAALLPGLTSLQQGLFLGNTLQAIGQVSAAGFSLGVEAGEAAVLLKMGRILMILPVTALLGLLMKKRGPAEGRVSSPGIPFYIKAFLVCALVGSWGILPRGAVQAASGLSRILLIGAMGAVGLKIRLKDLGRSGSKALLLGACGFLCQLLFSLTLIALLF